MQREISFSQEIITRHKHCGGCSFQRSKQKPRLRDPEKDCHSSTADHSEYWQLTRQSLLIFPLVNHRGGLNQCGWTFSPFFRVRKRTPKVGNIVAEMDDRGPGERGFMVQSNGNGRCLMRLWTTGGEA